MSLAHKTISGVIWNFAEQVGRQGIGLVITLLLARLLTPADFGLVAMMAVFLAIGSLGTRLTVRLRLHFWLKRVHNAWEG